MSPYYTQILVTETADSTGRLYDVEGNLKEMFAPYPTSIDTRMLRLSLFKGYLFYLYRRRVS